MRLASIATVPAELHSLRIQYRSLRGCFPLAVWARKTGGQSGPLNFGLRGGGKYLRAQRMRALRPFSILPRRGG